MKKFFCTSILIVFVAIIPTVSTSTVLICNYSGGAEIVVDTKDFTGTRIDINRTSPQKMMTHKIHIANKLSFNEAEAYLEVTTAKYKHTYALTCKRQ